MEPGKEDPKTTETTGGAMGGGDAGLPEWQPEAPTDTSDPAARQRNFVGPEVQDKRKDPLKKNRCFLKKNADYPLQRAEKALQKPLSLRG